jgi:DNA repair ATPase RecN
VLTPENSQKLEKKLRELEEKISNLEDLLMKVSNELARFDYSDSSEESLARLNLLNNNKEKYESDIENFMSDWEKLAVK